MTPPMLATGARATPWQPLIGASTFAAVLLGLSLAVQSSNPGICLLLARTALGALAGGGAFILDEPAAAVVDVSPRSRAWRYLGRAPALAVPLAVWSVGVLALVQADPTLPATGLWLEGAAVLAAVSATAGMLRRMLAAPGQSLAGTAALAVVGLYVFAGDRLRIYAEPASTTGARTTTAWLALLALSFAGITAAAREPRRRDEPAADHSGADDSAPNRPRWRRGYPHHVGAGGTRSR